MDENEETREFINSLSPLARSFFVGAGISVVCKRLEANPELLNAIEPSIKNDVVRACAWAANLRKSYEDFTKSFN